MKHLLSGEDPEKVVSQIHDYLRDLGDRMRNNAIPAYKYTIYTQLGKNPQDYLMEAQCPQCKSPSS